MNWFVKSPSQAPPRPTQRERQPSVPLDPAVEYASLESTLQHFQQQKAALLVEREQIFNSLDGLQAENRALQDRRRKAQTKFEETQKRSFAFEAYKPTIQKLREENSGMRALLNEADQLSGADVVQLVKDLTTMVNNLAATIADAWDSEEGVIGEGLPELPPKELGTRVEEAKEQLQREIGTVMVRDLIDPKAFGERISTTILYAVQASFAKYLKRVTKAFCFGIPPGQDVVLSSLYDQIYVKETMALSSKWRNLTHTYVRQSDPDREKDAKQQIVSDLLQSLSHIHLVAGCKVDVKSYLESQYEGDLQDLAESILSLSISIKEKVSSSKIRVYVPQCDQEFDDQRMNRERAKEGQRVMSSVEMGLLQYIRNKNSSGDTVIVLIKSKVLCY